MRALYEELYHEIQMGDRKIGVLRMPSISCSILLAHFYMGRPLEFLTGRRVMAGKLKASVDR